MGGLNGPRGVLLECESRLGRKYWKVRLQEMNADGGSKWVWPDALGGIVVDGPLDMGAHPAVVDLCQSCGLRFIKRAGSGELICERCDAETFGTAARASEPPPVKPKGFSDTRPRRRFPHRRGHS
jgi:hypothetical protein